MLVSLSSPSSFLNMQLKWVPPCEIVAFCVILHLIVFKWFLEKAMAPHSSTLAWKIPWMEEPGGLPSMGSHRVGHDWSDLAAACQRMFCLCSLLGLLWSWLISWLIFRPLNHFMSSLLCKVWGSSDFIDFHEAFGVSSFIWWRDCLFHCIFLPPLL